MTLGHPPVGRPLAWRLAAFYAALFVALGVQLPFLPVWLAAKGLDAREIGIVLAIPMIVRLFAVPIATRAADQRDAVRAAIVIAAAAAMVGYGAVGLAHGTLAIMAVFAVASAFYTPLMPLADAYALRGLRQHGRAYGPVRLWGSAAFIAGSFIAGFLLDLIAARDLIWLIAAAMALTTMAALALVPLGEGQSSPRAAPLFAQKLWRNPAFVAVVAAVSLIQASHAVYYGFSTLAWQADGFGGVSIGALWAIGVLAEIVLFAVSGRLALDPIVLLLLGAAGAVARWGVMALDPPLGLLPLLQCLHGLSFGATHLGALGFIVRTAPPSLGASAQGYLAVAQGLAMAAAMGLSGVLYARLGALAYGAMALMAAVGGLLALAVRIRTQQSVVRSPTRDL